MSTPPEDQRIHFALRVDQMFWQAAVASGRAAEEEGSRSSDALKYLRHLSWYAAFIADDLGDEIDFSVVMEEHGLADVDIDVLLDAETTFVAAHQAFLRKCCIDSCVVRSDSGSPHQCEGASCLQWSTVR
jgi:hypothetical protein